MYFMNVLSSSGKDARSQLIGAAKSLLWEVGYESMSPRKVLQRSGAGHGSLYHHFSGKEDLAVAALQEIEDELIASFDALLRPDVPPLERVRRFLKKKRDGEKGCQLGGLTNEASVSTSPLKDPIARYFAHAETVLTHTIREAKALGEVRTDVKPRNLACCLLATVQGGYVLSRAHGDSTYSKRACDGAISLLNSATP